MRALLLPLLLLPATAGAQDLADTHFARNFCWERTYDRDHLAAHPEQMVTHFEIGREPLGEPVQPGETVMTIRLRLRGVGDELEAVGYCDPDGQRLSCGLEGDAGNYMIEAEGPDNLLVTVGDRHMLFEGRRDNYELRSDEGDDRSFLLGRCG